MIRHPLAIQLDPEQRQQVFALMRGIKTEYRLKQRATLIWQVAEDHCSPKTPDFGSVRENRAKMV